MAGTPIAGKYGRVTIAGTSVTFDSWKVSTQGVDIPTTNFEDQSGTETYTSGITGPLEASIECSGFYDTAAVPWVAPLALLPGVRTFVNPNYMFLYSNKNIANSRFVFASIRIINANQECNVNGRVNFTMSAKSNGVFTYPSA